MCLSWRHLAWRSSTEEQLPGDKQRADPSSWARYHWRTRGFGDRKTERLSPCVVDVNPLPRASVLMSFRRTRGGRAPMAQWSLRRRRRHGAFWASWWGNRQWPSVAPRDWTRTIWLFAVQMGPVRLRHCSHHFSATQSSHFVVGKPKWLPLDFE